MKVINFKIPLVPKPQMRVRHFAKQAKSGKQFSGTYKATEQQDYENMFMPLLAKHKPDKPLSGAIELAVIALLPIPQSKPLWWRKALFHKKVFHTCRPDIDNLLKNLLDCMEKVGYFNNDSQICSIYFRKVYNDEPCWLITLKETQMPKTKKEYFGNEDKQNRR